MEYQYIERPNSVVLGRRGFLKVFGVCVAAVAIVGYAVTDLIMQRNKVIKARQAGLYEDDKLCQKAGMPSSHKNKVCTKFYEDMKAKPVTGISYELLHTHYVARNTLAMGEKHHG